MENYPFDRQWESCSLKLKSFKNMFVFLERTVIQRRLCLIKTRFNSNCKLIFN